MAKQNKPMTVYLAHGISDKANFHDSLRIAQEIESIQLKDREVIRGRISQNKTLMNALGFDFREEPSLEEIEEAYNQFQKGIMLSSDDEFEKNESEYIKTQQEYLNAFQKFEVYAPAGNKKINDKSNNPTPIDIYDEDMKRLDSHDVVVANYTGVNSLGTLLEISTLGAYYQKVKQIVEDVKQLEVELTKDLFTSQKYMDDEYASAYEQGYASGIETFINKFINQQMNKLPKVFVYTSNARTIQPQLYNPRLQEQYDPEKHGKNLFGFIASGSENHMVVGMIVRHLNWCETEEEVMEKLRQL